VQLQVPGVKVDPAGNSNDESLIVPTTAAGAKRLNVTAFKRAEAPGVARSIDDKLLI
jgi:hypothetical protein